MDEKKLQDILVKMSNHKGEDVTSYLTIAELNLLPEAYAYSNKIMSSTSKGDKATEDLKANLKNTYSALLAQFEAYKNSPEGQKAIAKKQLQERKGELTDLASEGLALMTTGLELGLTGKYINEAKSDLASVKKPTVPGIPEANPAIKEAVNLARERAYNPYSSPEVNALLGSQAMDTMKGLQVAKQVSGGQASQYQSAAQDVVDRARMAKIQSVGALQEGQRQAQQNFLNAAQAQSAETLQRANMAQNLYQLNNQTYMFEKGLADAALSAQRGNMMTALQNAEIRLPSAIGGAVARLYPKPTYTGMGDNVDNQNFNATQVLNRLRNQQMLFNPSYNNLTMDNYGKYIG